MKGLASFRLSRVLFAPGYYMPGYKPAPVVLAWLAICGLGVAEEAEDYEALTKRGAYREALAALEAKIEPRKPYVPSYWLKDRAELRFRVGEADLAIGDYQELIDHSSDVGDTLRLAELYLYRGRMEDYKKALDDGERRIRGSWNSYNSQDTLLAAGKLAELRGEDPKRILTTVYGLLMERSPDFAPGFIAAGRLAYSKGSYAAAAKYFQQALEAESDSQEALAGLAACYWESRDERLEDTLKSIEAINPHLPEAVAVRVEMLLDAGEVAEAREHINPILEVNPNQLLFRALKAAALFLGDDEAAMETLQRDTLAFNPKCSEVYRVPGRVASRHYRFKEAEGLLQKALAINEDDHAARAELAINLLRLGRDEEGKKELDAAFTADPYNVKVFNSLKALDTLAKYETVSSGPFQVQLPAEEASVLAPAAIKLLNEEIDLLQKKYAIQIETPVRVQIFDNHDDFMVRSVGLPGNAGHLGICFGQLITMDSPSARSKGTMDWHAVLWHEFAHVITLQKTNNRLPRWLSEGISVHEETVRNPAWGTRLEPGYGELLGGGELPGASDLELLFTQPKTPQHLMLGYYLAGEFVGQFVKAHGESVLVNALERVGKREPALEALASAAGVTVAQLDEDFRAYLKGRLAVLNDLPAFRETMVRGAEAAAAQNWPEAEKAFQEARRLLPEYSGSDGPLAQLAGVYEATADHNKLEETLRAWLALDSATLTAWQRLASLYRDGSNWEGVLYAASGAAAVDPFDVEMSRALFEAQQALGKREDALATAERLLALDKPRATEYELARVKLLMELEQWAEAKRQVVLLLEGRPHYWDAQELLLALSEQNPS